ncbi:GNAT family N-acetyltransferase [Rhodobium gokarnense]|uniref:Ribosomal protein S18 acetylase RimI-like enzyme n=1 Tax=Rhodobium gokarnense TaxID=364296 RepID=A0ABT3H6H1_9HYPH|nr:GNAT family N-acetyltransferase [Rhodobium gokarnense]MCW2305990.1 ribosomal protein S18 acetylase RimI-like enzyme [Rhodobium gokarnense]
MTDIAIRLAGAEDAERIQSMLARLAVDLGETTAFASSTEILRHHGFGEEPLFHCLIAERDGTAVGLVLFFPEFSTLRGMPGVYVQDLWVDRALRSSGLGKRLLAAAARHGAASWQAGYMKLTVHLDNPRAERFYRRHGFANGGHDQTLTLEGPDFGKMSDPT